MAWIRFFILFILCVVRTDGRAYRNDVWTDCTPRTSPVTITNLNILPNPVTMPGDIQFTIQGFSNRTLDSSRLVLDIRRIIRVFGSTYYFPTPCLFNIGSCIYDDMCTLLETMISDDWLGITQSLGTDIKNMLINNGMNPGLCPQPPTEMSILNNRISLPRMPSALTWFAEGRYNANVKVYDNSNDEQLVCFDVTLDVKQEEEVQEEECSGYFGCIFGRK